MIRKQNVIDNTISRHQYANGRNLLNKLLKCSGEIFFPKYKMKRFFKKSVIKLDLKSPFLFPGHFVYGIVQPDYRMFCNTEYVFSLLID
jgi:hypothetical protein